MRVTDELLTENERVADRNAHASRVAMLGVDLGRRPTRFLLRLLQRGGIFPRT